MKGSSDNGFVGYYAKSVYTTEDGSKLSTTEDGFVLYTDGALVSLVAYIGNATSLSLPNNVTEINHGAFYNRADLSSITIPNSVTSIGDHAFYRCTRLASINYQGSKAQWREISKERYWDLYTGDYIIKCTNDVINK